MKNIPTKVRRSRAGRPEFRPTKEQRSWVEAMAGFKMTWDEIASLILNPETNQPISKETLGKHFKMELDTGKQRLKSKVSSRYLERLEAGEWNAISFGLRHFLGYGQNDVNIGINDDLGGGGIKVNFVLPDKRPEE